MANTYSHKIHFDSRFSIQHAFMFEKNLSQLKLKNQKIENVQKRVLQLQALLKNRRQNPVQKIKNKNGYQIQPNQIPSPIFKISMPSWCVACTFSC